MFAIIRTSKEEDQLMNVIQGRTWLGIGVTLCVLAGASASRAADEGKDEQPAAAPLPPVAATIDGDPLFVAEVDVMLDSILKSRANKTKEITRAKAETLDQLINRRLALLAMQKDGGYLDDAEIEKGMNKLKAQMAAQQLTLEQYAVQRGVTAEVFRKELAWQSGWGKYLERYMSEGLETYFKEHHADYDGTLVRASHIVLRTERPNESFEQVVERSKKIRAEIEAGKISFEEAAERYSVGPSRRKAGDLGYFPRYGVMLEPFAKAAFELQKDGLSEPVMTPFGVHLIRVTDVRRGNKQWTEVVDLMKSHRGRLVREARQ